MNLHLDILTTDLCKLLITDKTEYPTISPASYKNYAYKDSKGLIIVTRHTSKGLSEVKIYVDKHEGDKTYTVPLTKDGYYTVLLVLIPSAEYALLNTYISEFTGSYYCIDQDGIIKIATYDKDSKKIVLSADSVNKEIFKELEDTPGNNIIKDEKEYICICHLKQCYINICREILDNMCLFGKCVTDLKKDSDLIFRRDVAWMAINVIKYLVKNNKLDEAGRIIELLSGCNGICLLSVLETVSNCGCGK